MDGRVLSLFLCVSQGFMREDYAACVKTEYSHLKIPKFWGTQILNICSGVKIEANFEVTSFSSPSYTFFFDPPRHMYIQTARN